MRPYIPMKILALRSHRNLKGFTFLELVLLIVVGTLISSVLMLRLSTLEKNTRRAELQLNLIGIRTAELSYHDSFHTYVECDLYPDSNPTPVLRDWDVEQSGNFRVIGWKPDGKIRGSYYVTENPDIEDFTATGISDLDGDGAFATFIATSILSPKMTAEPNAY